MWLGDTSACLHPQGLIPVQEKRRGVRKKDRMFEAGLDYIVFLKTPQREMKDGQKKGSETGWRERERDQKAYLRRLTYTQ